MIDFLYGTNETLTEKAYNLIKCWRVGVNSCHSETDLIVLSMYLKVLSTDLTDYNITTTEVRTIINHIINIFNITNVTVDDTDIINYITNTTVNNIYTTTTVEDVPKHFATYSGTGEFDVTVIHYLNTFNTDVKVTDTTSGRVRVTCGITEVDENTIVCHFVTDSAGEILVSVV